MSFTDGDGIKDDGMNNKTVHRNSTLTQPKEHDLYRYNAHMLHIFLFVFTSILTLFVSFILYRFICCKGNGQLFTFNFHIQLSTHDAIPSWDLYCYPSNDNDGFPRLVAAVSPSLIYKVVPEHLRPCQCTRSRVHSVIAVYPYPAKSECIGEFYCGNPSVMSLYKS